MASPLNPTRVHVAQVHEDLKKDATKRQAPAEWQGSHPWRPWDREKDLDVRQVISRRDLGEISRDLGDQDRDARQAKPKGKDSVLNDPIMGDLKSRFGGRHRETTFM